MSSPPGETSLLMLYAPVDWGPWKAAALLLVLCCVVCVLEVLGLATPRSFTCHASRAPQKPSTNCHLLSASRGVWTCLQRPGTHRAQRHHAHHARAPYMPACPHAHHDQCQHTAGQEGRPSRPLQDSCSATVCVAGPLAVPETLCSVELAYLSAFKGACSVVSTFCARAEQLVYRRGRAVTTATSPSFPAQARSPVLRSPSPPWPAARRQAHPTS